MTPQTLQQWLDEGETQTQEFKTSFDKSSIETLVGFANAKGGRVLVGVTDQGTLQGTTLGKESLNEWLVQIKAATSPSIIPEIEAYSFNGNTMVVISVAEFPVKSVSTKGRYYKRVSNTNQALNASEISDLYMQSLQLSWDSYPAHNAQLQDLSMDKLVAEAFYLTTGIEKYGSGFIRMRKALADYPEVQLLVEEISGGISITFTKTHDEVSEGVSEGLNEGVNALKERIVQNPGLRANALAESLQTSVKNVERWLKQLKDQGLIEFRGAPKTGGYHPSSFDDTKASA